jgi:hypothetical protein
VANDLYPSARESFLTGEIDWMSDDIRIVLVDVGYVYSSAHDFLDDVGAGFRVATSSSLTGKDATGGVADASDVTLTAVSGDDIEGVIVYQHTGVDATSRLIAFYDLLASGVEIDVTPDGTDARVRWSNGATKMFMI